VMGAIAEHYGGCAFGMMTLASASKDRVRVTMLRGTMLNVHATYPCIGGGGFPAIISYVVPGLLE
jgi:hypothetical protein